VDERGSVVAFIGFALALAVGGLLLSVLAFVPAGVDSLHLRSSYNGQVYDFLLLFWGVALPVIILVGTISWFLTRLQKKYYEVY
jgi:hypothetical protein